MKNIYVHKNGFVARHEGILLQFWRDRIQLDGVRAAHKATKMIMESGIQPFALYIENAPQTKPPDSDMRKLLVDIGLHSEGCQACAFVAAGGGFVSAANRAIMSSLSNIVRVGYPLEVSKGPEEGLTWLAQQIGMDPRELLDVRSQMIKAWDLAVKLNEDTAPPPVAEPAAPNIERPARKVPTSLKDAFRPRR